VTSFRCGHGRRGQGESPRVSALLELLQRGASGGSLAGLDQPQQSVALRQLAEMLDGPGVAEIGQLARGRW